MFYLFVAKKIEKLRVKLHESIDKTGLNSQETRQISVEMDILINNYYRKDIEYPERKYFKGKLHFILY